ncbi:hypothetical protein J2S49_001269 [Arcanobacterium wilhelmae]|uniref:Transposase n=1 Tax=Arcanobacterium wilhelmae TaxID=1803177 RepID=A0ABT9NBV5_9ACTO|nr:hypothetical protein [Arcanobacterium wilhelmae]MDP9801193.1 hypothetical protein [Arcanobacterium wilhelmae]WFN90545.1 hypothetical protein P8A24_01400 [Arcanobacterium wilhelmae]
MDDSLSVRGWPVSDAKAEYSSSAKRYIDHTEGNPIDIGRVARARDRERRYNSQWLALAVDINQVVEKYTPGVRGKPNGYKWVYRGERYEIRADMIVGYLRVYDLHAHSFLNRMGVPSSVEQDTHFKILKREEM